MNKVLRHILIGIGGTVLAAGMVIAFTAGVSSRRAILCKGLEINIIDSLHNSFVTKTDIRAYIDKEYGQYIGVPIDSIDLVRIEDIVDGRSAVRKSEAFVTKDGMMHIKVTQRKPVVRFQKADGGFYADAEGFLFPLQSSYASRVQVIDGEIPLKANSGYKGELTDEKEKAWLKNVLNVVSYMENSRIWKDKIVQISVCDGGELVMVPRIGKERFHFGQPDNIEEKFRKMELYYTGIVPAKGDKEYSKVSLEYEGQIICR